MFGGSGGNVYGGEVYSCLESLLHNLPGAVYRGFRDWSINFAGQYLRELTGYEPETFVKKDLLWKDIVHPEDIGRLKKIFKGAVRRGDRVLITRYRIVRRDGAVKWVEDRRQIFYDEEGKFSYVDGLLLDVTESVELEKALRESEERYRSLIDNIDLGITFVNTSFDILTVNRAQGVLLGNPASDLIGKKCYRMFGNREDVCPECPGVRALETGKKEEVEKEGIRGDGSRYTVRICAFPVFDNEGIPTGFIELVEDITEWKKTQQALIESERKYRSVTEESLVGVYVIQDGLFRYVNKRFCEMFGYEYDEIVDRLGPLDLTHPDYRSVVEENIRRRLEGEKDTIEYELEVIHRSGSTFPVRVLGRRATYRGRPAVIGTILDLSKEKELEKQLFQAQKMEAVGRLAGGIAHDINNYLSAITGYAELLKLGCGSVCEESEKVKKYVEIILDVSSKASRIINQLLAYSRRQIARPEVVDVNAVIMDMKKVMERLLGEDVTLRTALERSKLNVKIDPAQLEQIFVNLLVNARDAMPEGGEILIETRRVYLDEVYSLKRPLVPPGDYVLIAVTDTGSGIPREIQDKIFDPFFTTKEKGKGSGLGLSTVYGIVKQNGGFIWVYSEPGTGTTFKLYLPLVEGAELGEKQSAKVQTIPAGGTGKILLVEDNDDVRESTAGLLEFLGYHVVSTKKGEDALEVLSRDGCFDLLLTDVVLPGVSGVALARKAKEMCKGLKVLYISGYTDDTISLKGLLREGVNFLQKPFSAAELAKAIKEALES